MFFFSLGWVDDSIFIRRPDPDDEVWSNGSSSVNPGAFTTGRRSRPTPPPIKPRSQVGNQSKLLGQFSGFWQQHFLQSFWLTSKRLLKHKTNYLFLTLNDLFFCSFMKITINFFIESTLYDLFVHKAGAFTYFFCT